MKDLIQQVEEALANERLQVPPYRVRVELDRGDLVLAGEVRDVASKKRALEVAASVQGTGRLVDRLHVRPSYRIGDDVLLDRVCEALAADYSLHPLLVMPHDPELQPLALPAGEPRVVAVSVQDGIVTLDGRVNSLGHKRLAGVLAWWVPGVRDVVNGIGVEPDEQDDDLELTGSVKLVLEKDPTVRADSIRIQVRDGLVVLAGTAATEGERRRIEDDVWAIFGVDRVESRLVVMPAGQRAMTEGAEPPA